VNNPARRLTGISTLHHIDELSELDPALPRLMQDIEPGQQQLLQTKIREVPVELRVSVSEIRLEGETERLYSIENLSGELTARESSAWRNLIRVLTHEIMNTLTPVTSLAQTCTTMLADGEITEDLREAVRTIARRSEGLMDFVSRYRELLHVPQPNPQRFRIIDALRSVTMLMQDELQSIETVVEVTPESLELDADPALIDQVLLNLLRNAAAAIADTLDAKIQMEARLSYGRIVIAVQDNGPGIPDNVREQMFVPFFTTKRDGSGIGLSLSRQIMTAHSGEIAVNSDANGTTVSLVF
jgi:nitrogen fixation/metabolism regulation signal transduction histidine kinase